MHRGGFGKNKKAQAEACAENITQYAYCAYLGAKLLLFVTVLTVFIIFGSFLSKFSLSYHPKVRLSIDLGNFLVRIVLQSKTDCAIIIGVEYIKTKIRVR